MLASEAISLQSTCHLLISSLPFPFHLDVLFSSLVHHIGASSKFQQDLRTNPDTSETCLFTTFAIPPVPINQSNLNFILQLMYRPLPRAAHSPSRSTSTSASALKVDVSSETIRSPEVLINRMITTSLRPTKAS